MWHHTTIDEAFQKAASTRTGLAPDEVQRRLQQYGSNSLQEKKRHPGWVIFLLQFKDFMIVVLVLAAVISGLIGDITDTIIILIIVLLNAVIGFLQEFNAERAMEALKKMSTVHASVIRNGNHMNVPSTELVPGDVVSLEAGNVIPADLRIIEAHNLLVNESALTGESVSVRKQTNVLEDQDIPLGDR